MRTSRISVLSAIALCVLAAVVATPALARPLGHNGRIAFARYDPFFDDTVPYTINPDGTHEQQVIDLPGELPNWSMDGTRLVTCCSPSGDSHAAADILDPDNPAVHVALPQPDPANLDAYCLLWSADANRLACESFGLTDPGRNGIYTIRSSDGGGLTRVTSAPGGDDVPSDYSPDGRRLVFAHFGADCACLSVVNVNGSGLHHIADGSGLSSFGSWSPQGNEIVFSRHVTPDVHSSLWVVHSDGSGLHEIHVQVAPGQYPCGAPNTVPDTNADPVQGGCFAPRWSPDGKKIVFGRGDDVLGRNIYTVNADGSGLFQVTHGDASESNEAPDWGTHELIG
jgi:hypothetical protein